jgi:hypothetical protein
VPTVPGLRCFEKSGLARWLVLDSCRISRPDRGLSAHHRSRGDSSMQRGEPQKPLDIPRTTHYSRGRRRRRETDTDPLGPDAGRANDPIPRGKCRRAQSAKGPSGAGGLRKRSSQAVRGRFAESLSPQKMPHFGACAPSKIWRTGNGANRLPYILVVFDEFRPRAARVRKHRLAGHAKRHAGAKQIPSTGTGPLDCSANLLHGRCRRGAVQRRVPAASTSVTEFKKSAVFLRIYFGMKKNVAN